MDSVREVAPSPTSSWTRRGSRYRSASPARPTRSSISWSRRAAPSTRATRCGRPTAGSPSRRRSCCPPPARGGKPAGL